MKYLAYLVKDSYGSWDEDDIEYKVQFQEPAIYENYKMVTIEVIEQGKSLGELFG